MMKQWVKMKTELGEDVILFCRIGDFYELFYEDAIVGAKELDIALTSRKIGNTQHPLAGVPVRSVDSYVSRLVSKGYKVAIADQLEDPKAVKGVVKRGITRIVTQGTLVDDTLLNAGKNNYIAALVKDKSRGNLSFGLAIADLSVGDFFVKEFMGDDAESLLKYSLDITSPVEYIFPESLEDTVEELIKDEVGRKITLTPKPDFWFDLQEATEVLHEHFEVKSLKGFGIADKSLAAASAG
ncbi:MAG: DNA mismatch repair protein MutS, partial [Methanobacteriota archaeon]